MSIIELYGFEGCPCAQRCRMALLEKGHDLALTGIDPFNRPAWFLGEQGSLGYQQFSPFFERFGTYEQLGGRCSSGSPNRGVRQRPVPGAQTAARPH